MKISRYNWDEEGAPELPHLDSVLQKFDKSIVITNEDNKVLGYAGFEEWPTRHTITSFWASKNNEIVRKTLITELKKELNFNKQKRIGMVIDKLDEKFTKLLIDNGWFVHLEDEKLEITLPSRACYQLSIPPGEIDKLRNINEHKDYHLKHKYVD